MVDRFRVPTPCRDLGEASEANAGDAKTKVTIRTQGANVFRFTYMGFTYSGTNGVAIYGRHP